MLELNTTALLLSLAMVCASAVLMCVEIGIHFISGYSNGLFEKLIALSMCFGAFAFFLNIFIGLICLIVK